MRGNWCKTRKEEKGKAERFYADVFEGGACMHCEPEWWLEGQPSKKKIGRAGCYRHKGQIMFLLQCTWVDAATRTGDQVPPNTTANRLQAVAGCDEGQQGQRGPPRSPTKIAPSRSQ